MKLHPIVLLHKASAGLLFVLKPLGVWGVGALALLDSALVPIPGGMDGILSFYVQANPKLFLLYCAMAAFAASLGSLVPFYIGRAGGELFLLKRINRERYERMRDRFERQEFFAILVPSMGPPPTPLKVFQFAAGVFEMKPATFLLATFVGKLIQFVIWSLLIIRFGPTISHTIARAFHQHLNIVLGVGALALVLIALWVARRMFDRRNREPLSMEEAAE